MHHDHKFAPYFHFDEKVYNCAKGALNTDNCILNDVQEQNKIKSSFRHSFAEKLFSFRANNFHQRRRKSNYFKGQGYLKTSFLLARFALNCIF